MNHTSGITLRARRVRRGLAIAMLCGGLTVGGCAISPQQEAQIGADYSAQINRELPIINDASLNNYINQVGSQIASRGQRGIPYRFYIVNSNVVNASPLEPMVRPHGEADGLDACAVREGLAADAEQQLERAVG